MALPEAIRILLVLTAFFTIPGWFILALNDVGKHWAALQRWCLAVAASIAFFPVWMYFLRILPDFRMGQNKWLALLAVMLLAAGWLLRKDWREVFRFDTLEGLAAAVLLATLFTRFWMAFQHPYPAWTDALHHTLLTQLSQSRLPETLQPYAPTPLNMYHLGLYAISGPVMLLAKVPAHTALLWTAQALNGLCGLGVYLVLDRRVGRFGGLVGAVVVGLFSFQPAWYFNWGRFTQVASQAIMPVAWLLTWETIRLWRSDPEEKRALWGMATISGLLNAAVFLLHFRVAFFYLPLLAVTLAVEAYRAFNAKTLRRFFAAILVVALVSLVLVSPALFSALKAYYIYKTQPVVLPAAISQQANPDANYEFPLSTLPLLGLQPWLLVVGLIALGWGLIRRRGFTLLVVAWTGLMVLEGLAYLLKVPLLKVTNMGAVLILLYMPLGFIVGQAAEDAWDSTLFARLGKYQPGARQFALGILLFAAFIASHIRTAGIEEWRFFLTPADVQAMQWIQANTPRDAVFAINTYFWNTASPHGSDGGFWIPYFSGRETTTSTMLFNLGPQSLVQQVIRRSLVVKDLRENYRSVDGLCQEGIGYIYLGAKDDFTGQGLDPVKLAAVAGIAPVYQGQGVSIFQVNCP